LRFNAPSGSVIRVSCWVSPATISGPARGHIDEFWVYFEALDDTASGVSFEVSYTYP